MVFDFITIYYRVVRGYSYYMSLLLNRTFQCRQLKSWLTHKTLLHYVHSFIILYYSKIYYNHYSEITYHSLGAIMIKLVITSCFNIFQSECVLGLPWPSVDWVHRYLLIGTKHPRRHRRRWTTRVVKFYDSQKAPIFIARSYAHSCCYEHMLLRIIISRPCYFAKRWRCFRLHYDGALHPRQPPPLPPRHNLQKRKRKTVRGKTSHITRARWDGWSAEN